MKITLKSTFIAISSFYIFFCLYLYLNQKALIYFPSKQNFYDCPWFKDFEKVNFSWTKFYYKRKTEKLIIVYHWNYWSACDRSWLKDILDKTDYSLLFVEYAWFSNDNYSPSINLIYRDVQNVKAYLNIQKFSKIIVYWESLWTWPATYHTSIAKVDKLLLISPFSTFLELVKQKYPIFPVKYLLKEDYDNVSNLKNYENELLIIHWNKDELISYNFWQELFSLVKTTKKEFFTIQWKWHNDLSLDNTFYDKILEFINK